MTKCWVCKQKVSPPGMYTVVQGREAQDIVWYFCCWGHLRQWVQNMTKLQDKMAQERQVKGGK